MDANAAKSAKRALKSARDQAPSAPKGLSPTAEPVLTFSEALPVLIHTLKQSPLESVEAVELAKGSETEDSRRALESVLASVYKHWFTKRKSLKGPLLRCYQLKDPNPDKKVRHLCFSLVDGAWQVLTGRKLYPLYLFQFANDGLSHGKYHVARLKNKISTTKMAGVL